MKYKYLKQKLLYFVAFFLFNGGYAYADACFELTHYKDKIHVSASFSKSTNYIGDVKLYVPGEIWGADYSAHIKNIEVRYGSFNNKSHTVKLYNESNVIFLDYDIVNIPIEHFKASFTNHYYHYITEDKFYLFGMGLFIVPEELYNIEGVEVSLTINTPISNLFLNLSNTQTNAGTKGPYRLDLWSLDDLIIIADNHMRHKNSDGYSIYLLSKNNKLFNKLSKMTEDIIKTQDYFWENKFYEHQHIVFIENPYLASMSNSYGGTQIKGTSIYFINPKYNLYSDLYYLLSHENLHQWIGQNIIGPTWFNEGFVDYYIDKIEYIQNRDSNKFVKKYNDKLHAYFTHPLIDLDPKVLEHLFFHFNAVAKIPYMQGYIIAGQIDSIIDLDKALKKMVHICVNDKKDCEFTLGSICSYIDNISTTQKRDVKNVLENIGKRKFREKFLDADLTWKEVIINNYLIDYTKILEGGYRYKNDMLKVQNIVIEDRLKLELLTPEDKIIRLVPASIPERYIIPYYALPHINR